MGKVITWIVVIAVVVIGGLAILNNQPATGEAIKIGFIGPLTGDDAEVGESQLRAIQVAVAEINEADGISGQPLELIVEDGKCDSQAAGAAAQKLVNIDQVSIIIGGTCLSEILAIAEVTEPAQVILISPSVTSPDVTEAGDFVFRTVPSDAFAGAVAARYAYDELGARTVAVITELTDYAQGLRDVFTDSFEVLGGEVVTDITYEYEADDTDIESQAGKIKKEEPDVIYFVPQSILSGITVIDQLRENEVIGTYMTADVLLNREVIEEQSVLLEGVVGVEFTVDYSDNPKANAFRDAHKATFEGKDPGSFAAHAYDTVYLLANAIEESGLDTEVIRDWLYNVENWPGAIGPLTIDKNGDAVLSLNVRKIEDGKIIDLGSYTP